MDNNNDEFLSSRPHVSRFQSPEFVREAELGRGLRKVDLTWKWIDIEPLIEEKEKNEVDAKTKWENDPRYPYRNSPYYPGELSVWEWTQRYLISRVQNADDDRNFPVPMIENNFEFREERRRNTLAARHGTWEHALRADRRRNFLNDPRFERRRRLERGVIDQIHVNREDFKRATFDLGRRHQDAVINTVRQRNGAGGFVSTRIASALAGDNFSLPHPLLASNEDTVARINILRGE